MGTSIFSLKKADDENNWLHFSAEEIKKRFLSDPSDRQRRSLRKKTLLVMDTARKDGMQPALEFLRKVISRQIPDEIGLVCRSDDNATLSARIIRHRGNAETAMLTVEFECLFSHPTSGKIFSAGNVKMDFRMQDNKTKGMWGYELDCIKTDSACVAAFLSQDALQVRDALSEIENNLENQEASFHSKTMNQRF